MSGWETVPVSRKKPQKGAAKPSTLENNARQQGARVETQQRFGAGTNKQRPISNINSKLDQETEELKHEKLSLGVSKLIMQGRQAKGLSQRELAAKICEKQQIITDYEAGRGLPNDKILAKIERVIELKLRGKDCGQPLPIPEKEVVKIEAEIIILEYE